MQKSGIAIIALIVISIGFLSGCNEQTNNQQNETINGDEEKIIGTWEYESSGTLDRVTFAANGSMYNGGRTYAYWLEDGRINITPENGDAYSIGYSFEGNDTLILTSEYDTRIYIRVG